MVECARHVNLVKAPTDAVNSETMIGCALSECDYKQHSLLKQLLNILEGDKLARLATAAVSVALTLALALSPNASPSYCPGPLCGMGFTPCSILLRDLMSLSKEDSILTRLLEDLERFWQL